jgi:hypothetical protein
MVRQVRPVDSDHLEECESGIVSSVTSGIVDEEVEVTVNASGHRSPEQEEPVYLPRVTENPMNKDQMMAYTILTAPVMTCDSR